MSKGLRAAVRSPTRRKALTAADLVSCGLSAKDRRHRRPIARKLSAVDRCMSILAGSMAKLPNYIFDSKDPGAGGPSPPAPAERPAQ